MRVRAAAVVVFAKEPRAGEVKTRLARTLGDARAVELYRAFLRDTLSSCARVDSADCVVAYSPPTSRAWFEDFAPAVQLLEQGPGDLGARLSKAFDELFTLGYERVLACGSDTPHVSAETITAALEACAPGRALLGPTIDGGYWCVGLTAPAPALFSEIAWSTGRVFQDTSQRARELGLETHALPATFDVDEEPDLDLLREELRSGGDCPATSELL